MTARRLARAAALVALFGLLSRFLGFIREMVIAAAYGTSAEADAFSNGLMIVNALAALLLYTLVTLVIPAFQKEKADHGELSAWRMISAIAFWSGAALVVVGSAFAIWPELPASLFGLDPAREAQTAEVIRIMAPALALQGFSALFTAMLQIHDRFAGPAAVGVAFNFGIIAAIVVGQGSLGIEAAAWGVTLGAVLQVVLQLPQFWRLVRASGVTLTVFHPRLGRVAWLAVPVMAASLLQQVNAFADKYFASSQEAGSVAALGYSSALGQAPRVALLLPLMTPLFPLIARLMSNGRHDEALAAFRRVGGLLAVVVVPMAIIMAFNANDVAQLAFKRQACDQECVNLIGPPLVFYALALWPSFLNLLINRTIAAGNHQRDILWTTSVTVLLTIALDAILIGPMGISGLALATAIAVTINTAMLLWLARYRFPRIGLRRFAARQVRVAGAGLVALAAAAALEVVLPRGVMSSWELAPVLAAKAAAVTAVFLAAAWMVARPEVLEGRKAVMSLVGRGPKAARP